MVIGLANRLIVADENVGSYIIDRAFEDWDLHEDPLGMLTVSLDGVIEKATRELALDTMTLLSLHEIGHALGGHMYFECHSKEEERAIEADADYGAGLYFCSWSTQLAEALRMSIPQSPDELFRRLSREAFLLTVLLREFSGKSYRYHLPPTRLFTILGGAAAAMGWQSSDVQRTQALKVFQAETYAMYMGFLQVGLDRFVDWEDAESNDDYERHNSVTWPAPSLSIAHTKFVLSGKASARERNSDFPPRAPFPYGVGA